MASTDARPMPRKNTAYRVTFPLYDADGDLVTGATSPDSEVSIDGGTFTDCTNEATEIATASGMYYLDLTAGEMNGDTIAVIVKSGTAKTLPLVFYPEEAGDVRVDVVQWLGTACATPTVAGVPEVDVTHWRGTAAAAEDTAGYPKVTIKDGTGTGELDTNAGKVALTDASIDSVWDELLTSSVHNTDNSAGQRLRRASAIATDGVVNDASATTTSFVVGGTVTTNDFFNDQVLVFTSGALAAQSKPVLDYDGGTKTITLSEALTSAPANGAEFVLIPTHVHPVSQIQSGLATAAALAVVDGIVDDILVDTGTTLQGELDGIQADTEDIQSRLPAALTAGGNIKADVLAISGDTTAADNAETAFDGGAYNVGGGSIVAASVAGAVGSVTGAVGSVTGNVGGNVAGSVGSVTGNVGGNVVGSVASVAAGGITASSIATGAIDADALAADAVDEIWDEVADGTLTARQIMKAVLAWIGGLTSGGGTTSIQFKRQDDTTNAISMTTDSDGDRSAVTFDLS